MRSIARVLVPLLAALALLAWLATALLSATARSWFSRDMAAKARLGVSGARDALARDLASADHVRLGAVLADLLREEHIMAAEACGPSSATLARSRGFPEQFACEALEQQRIVTGDPAGSEFAGVVRGVEVHVSVVPVRDDDRVLGSVVLVHDLSFIAQRESLMRQATFAVFAIVALLASLLTTVLRQMTWRSWTEELRMLLRAMAGGLPERRRRTSRRFEPLVADLRQSLTELTNDMSSSWTGRWTGQRLLSTLNRYLGGEGVVVVANREPYVHDRASDGTVRVLHPSSGLVTALEPVMRACSGTWVAHGSGSADRETVDRHDRLQVPPGETGYNLRRVWLTAAEERGYYYGFSNEGLWPLCHVAHARPTFRTEDWLQYQRVNERFADVVCEEVNGPDPIVLVQDYHFALLPSLLRQRLPRATTITFWHIPWPNAEAFGICPWGRELLLGLLGSSIVGFHTQLHCNNFLDAVDRYLEARVDREATGVVLGGRECLVRSYPISIEWPNRWAEESPPVASCRREVFAELGLARDALLGVGVDRLDYTKGVEERLLAVERLLERFPRLRGRFTFAQLAAPSRTLIERYRALGESVEALAERINQRFGSGSYRPIVLLRAHHEPQAIFRWLRAADLCYVSSLHDGMNLVAKEFVAARDDERGVLVLSRFTGAARELTEALIVNPYDLEQASDALAAALSMPASEQAERMRAMRRFVSEFNVYRWAGRMLADAARVRQAGRLSHRLPPVIGKLSGTTR
jgi:trehalose 6-phosphate synthase